MIHQLTFFNVGDNTKNSRVAPFGEAFTIRCSVERSGTEHQ